MDMLANMCDVAILWVMLGRKYASCTNSQRNPYSQLPTTTKAAHLANTFIRIFSPISTNDDVEIDEIQCTRGVYSLI